MKYIFKEIKYYFFCHVLPEPNQFCRFSMAGRQFMAIDCHFANNTILRSQEVSTPHTVSDLTHQFLIFGNNLSMATCATEIRTLELGMDVGKRDCEIRMMIPYIVER